MHKLVVNDKNYQTIKSHCHAFLCQAKFSWVNTFLLVKSILFAMTQKNKIQICQSIETWIANESGLLNNAFYDNKTCWKWMPLIKNVDLKQKYKIPSNKLFQLIIHDLKELQLKRPNISMNELDDLIRMWKQEHNLV